MGDIENELSGIENRKTKIFQEKQKRELKRI
jgi:hypothetical protein